MSAPEISVVVVCFRSAATLARCLEALKVQTFRNFEVILVDNASPEGEAQSAAADDPSLRLLELGDNLGFAAGNNRAAEIARGRELAFLNPDAFPEPEWLERLLAARARRHEARTFASLQLADADPGLLDGAGDAMTAIGFPYRSGYGRSRFETPDEGEVFGASGTAMMIDRELFLELGGFDERFFCYCEDVDLAWRLRLRGERTVFVPDAVVRHVGSASLGVRSDFALRHGVRNRLWAYLKNAPPLLLLATLLPHAAATLALVAVDRARGRKAALEGLREGVSGLRETLRARRRVQARRAASSLDLLPALVWSPLAAVRRSAKTF